MKRTPINRFSLKRIAEINAEAPIRVQLAIRAHGVPVQRQVTVYHSGQAYYYTKVECLGGICEKCGKPAAGLEPHEKVFRSQGGVLSLENTIMVHRHCHRVEQTNEPMWSKP